MCGIAGIAILEGDASTLTDLPRMCAATAHRGPDDCGFYADSHVALGMRRLSIIDLETGRQPITNEDRTVWVVLNGEIYNFRMLRMQLKRAGHTFCSSSDTEVIVHLYEEHGPRCVEKLRGMFAFALWDQKKKQLLLARDRLGIKPLYYAEIGGRLIFASELKAILEATGVPRDIDWEAVCHLFAFLSTPPSQSILRGIRKLEPAHILIASPWHPVRVERYWDVSFQPDRDHSETYFTERLRDLLEESVRLHMISDVPVGAFLSGGIDSGSVVATMARSRQAPVKTFSIGFPDQDVDELAHARQIARKFGTDHHELVIDPDVVAILEEMTWYLDEPFGDSSAIPTYMVSKLASQHVTVVLSGDGGDEVFAGYDKYVVESRERGYRFLPGPVRKSLGWIGGHIPDGVRGRNLLHHISLPGGRRYLDAHTLFRLTEMKRLFAPEVYRRIAAYDPWSVEAAIFSKAGSNWLSAAQYLDLNCYLPLDILTKVDRMSMAHSIEARVPLLDHVVVEFAATIPPELRLNGGTTKYILRKSMRGVLPDSIIDRPKRGFAIPLGRWFRSQLGPFVRDLLLSERSRNRGVFDPRHIERLIEQNDRGRDLGLHLWTLMSFELWCRTYLDEPRTKVTRRDDGTSDSARARRIS